MKDLIGKKLTLAVKSDIGIISTGYASGEVVDCNMGFVLYWDGTWRIYISSGYVDIESGSLIDSGNWANTHPTTSDTFSVKYADISNNIGSNLGSISNDAPEWTQMTYNGPTSLRYILKLTSNSSSNLAVRDTFSISIEMNGDLANAKTFQIIFDATAMTNNNG